MAQRRMFSKQVVQSSKFLRMPATSRLLYYDLGMAADDDGYCEWYPVLLASGAKEQDMQVLNANGLVFIFDNEVLIVKDWKTNNFIRPDRYQPSKYLGKYEELIGIPMVNQGSTQVRLGKVNTTSALGSAPVMEVKDEPQTKTKSIGKYPHAQTVFSWFPKREPSWDINTTQLKYGELLFLRGAGQVRGALAFLAEHKDEDYCPRVTKPSDLESKWQDILAFKKKLQ